MMNAAAIDLNTVVVQTEDLLSSELDGDTVLMSLTQAAYYGLDSTAQHIWKMIAQPCRVADLCEQIVSEYAVERYYRDAKLTEIGEGIGEAAMWVFIAIFLAAYGRSEGDPLYNACGDFDGDGIIGIFDYQWTIPGLLVDDFTGTTLDPAKWTASAGVTQNDAATVVGAMLEYEQAARRDDRRAASRQDLDCIETLRPGFEGQQDASQGPVVLTPDHSRFLAGRV